MARLTSRSSRTYRRPWIHVILLRQRELVPILALTFAPRTIGVHLSAWISDCWENAEYYQLLSEVARQHGTDTPPLVVHCLDSMVPDRYLVELNWQG